MNRTGSRRDAHRHERDDPEHRRGGSRTVARHVPGIGTFTIPRLDPGQSSTRTFTCRRGAITATADYSQLVPESNEANNSTTRNATCT